jgi:hypothetical protein
MDITWEFESERAALRGAAAATGLDMAEQAMEDECTAESVWLDLVAAFSRDREIGTAPVLTVATGATVSVPRRRVTLRSLVSRFIPAITWSLA